MNNIRQFTSKQAIYEQAAEWISKIDRGLSEQETQQLQAWLETSSGHRRMLEELASLWDEMTVLSTVKTLSAARAVKPRAAKWQALWGRGKHAIAASLLIGGLGLMLLGAIPWLNHEPSNTVAAAQRIATAIGEQRNIKLADGSLVQMNTNSIIEIDFSGDARRISLQRGEAHFTVAHDHYRPFVVQAGDNTVTAIGTAFNMQLTDDKAFELVVTEGRVLVRQASAQPERSSATALIDPDNAAAESLVVSGEKTRIAGEIGPRQQLSDEAVQEDLAWQQGMIVFKAEPLASALQEIGRYTPVTFAIEDEALQHKRVAGYFKVGDISGLLAALRTSFNIQHEREGMTIKLRQASPAPAQS